MSFSARERGMGVASVRQMVSKNSAMVFSLSLTPALAGQRHALIGCLHDVSRDAVLADEKRNRYIE